VLNNIKRHSDARSVTLEAELSGEEFVVTLSDDGGRFEPQSKSKGRGIRNIRSRAALIKADVDWLSDDMSANRFVLRMPVRG
jgi:two-component system, NarL family, sensor histidine kinase DegS